MLIRRATLRKMADGTCYSTFCLVASDRIDGKTLHVRKTAQAEPQQRDICRVLGVSTVPGSVRKMIQ